MIEIWKDIKDYEGIYQISNLGMVKSLNRLDSRGFKRKGKILKCNTNNKGYLEVILCKNGKTKHILIHRLVAIHFVKNPNEYKVVNHIDGVKQNNKVSNLEWCTQSYNLKHAYLNGLCEITDEIKEKMSFSHKGEKSYNYGKKLSNKTKIKMKESKKGKYLGEDNPMYGKKHSDETKLKISNSNKKGDLL